ncbi:putative 28S ribosomal mitochondrial [Brachionus plicatilis]|uniref:Small ribosomal subunit protein mS26 n=1 Tax=Brachionus plicatilis TaxID=10195 RepID=A0A3M7QW18_BRAPC|nr:putative 28S ribosomal mitochondrial [Brachionus plicatilis]
MLKSVTNSVFSSFKSLSIEQTRSIRLRKPPWVPRAKNKRFWIPPLKQQDRDEHNYMIPIWNKYKAEMRSVYLLFKTVAKFSDKESAKAQEEKKKQMEKEYKQLEENDQVNAEILKKQLEEENLKLETKKKEAELDFIKQKKIEELYLTKADKIVGKLIEKSKNFIDPNNLEYEIEKALNERYDHNFSIDSSGRFFKAKTIVTKSEAFDPKFIPKSTQSILPDTSSQQKNTELAETSP